MKRCPECDREYWDESLSYCLEDGVSLVSADEPPTAILSTDVPTSEAATPNRLNDSTAEKSPLLMAHQARPWLLPLLAVLVFGALGYLAYLYFPSGASSKPIDSVAVLPFVNKSGNPDSEYLSDGIAESLVYRLSQLPDLKVSPPSTVSRYRGVDVDPVQAGNELGVSAVVLGKIVERDGNLTVSAELIDVRQNKLLWGEQYDRKMSDLLATQREIARERVTNLRLKVTGSERGLAKNYTESNEAYQLYLKGRFFWNKRTPESIRKAIELFGLAIEKDPGFALAYVGLADSYVVPANRMPPREAMPKAKAAAMRALEIDDSLAEAHTSLARVLQVYDWNWKEAEKEFKRAIELNPRYAVAHQWYGGYLERQGDLKEGISERKLALELDPLSTTTNFELGQAYYFARDHDQAIAQYQRTLELDPSFPAALQYLPLAYLNKGMHKEALAKIQETPESAGFITAGALAGVPAYVLAVTGHTSQARTMLDELKLLREQHYVPAVSIALVHAGLGERDAAFAWLEKGYEERAFQMQFLNLDPRWDSLRSDARFADIVRRMGLPEPKG